MSARPVRLYLDQCIQRPVAEALRSVGIDATNAHEEGRLDQDDLTQLEFAASQQRAILTFNINGDFVQLHEEWGAVGREHWGILLSPEYKNIRLFIAACRHTLANHYPDESYMRNQLFWIQRPPQ